MPRAIEPVPAQRTGTVLPARPDAPRRHRNWAVVYVGLAVAPLVLSLAAGPMRDESWTTELSLATGLVAASLLVAAYALPSRVRRLSAGLGIETVLLSHRVVALLATVLVLGHVALVVVADPDRLRVLDLRDAPPRVWAGTTGTLALVLLVALAASRRRRRPRYEGWRLLHIVLATVVVVATALHVWWLHHLVSHPVLASWFGLLAAILVGLLVFRWVWRPLRARRHRYVVAEVKQAAPTAVTVVLHAIGHEGIPFEAGQFAWLKLGGSPFVFEEHPFTIASTATEPWRKEFTIKALGDFSELVAGLRPGRTVYLDGPHGRFTLADLPANGFVFVAGGVGVTPMLSMLRTMADDSDPRPALLLVGGRTVGDLVHRDEIARLVERLDLTVAEVVAEPPDRWAGERGFINRAVIERYLPGARDRRRRQWFVCGPPPMISAVLRDLRTLGVPRSHVQTERFDMV
jgi:3-phenylpropionate/trans-cinnamate dioxygenase ferredoxin reductase subunit